jgi:hypothetical protein
MQLTTNELLAYIFGDQAPSLAAHVAAWMAASSRYQAFVATYRDKIRKKVRGARDAEALKDLFLELETASMLLQERRFDVEYEKYGVGKARGPDFVITFKTRLRFNLEVTRLRAAKPTPDHDAPDQQYEVARLVDMVCGKLGQMLPSMINILIVFPDDDRVDHSVVMRAMARLKERAERKDIDFFTRKGFGGTQDFFKQYHRLSGILVRSSISGGPARSAALWENLQARHRIPTDLQMLLQK